FDVVGHSVLVTRQQDGGIKAMRNVCLHRGRKLVTQGGNKPHFRCPYHGFTWNPDGSFKGCPLQWDFPQLEPTKFVLREARLEAGAGFIFANFDPDARPLVETLDPIPRHFERWNMDDCYKAAHVAKLMPANWKATIEAFLEASHVATTHPQVAPYIADANSQYDLLSQHVDRFMTPIGMPSSQSSFVGLPDEEVFRHMV